MLGGSSSLNAMLYVRGNKRDYDRWEEMGNTGWSYDNVLPYFKKSESNKRFQNKYHAQTGPIAVDYYRNVDPYKQMILDAMSQQKYKILDDFNGAKNLGFGLAQGTVYQGQRFSTAESYLSTAKNQSNFNIIENAYVTTLIIDALKQAKGVNFILNGKEIKAFAKKEIILSAGAIGSPRILLSSGIGPWDDLKALNISVIKDSPVGKNLQDHVVVEVSGQFDKSTAKSDSLSNYIENLSQFLLKREGPFVGVGVTDVLGFLNTKIKIAAKYPDTQYMFFGIPKQSIGFTDFVRNFGYTSDFVNQYVKINNEGYLMVMYCAVLNPESRGKVELRSNNPLDLPKITTNYLANSDDVATLVRGIRKIKNFYKTKSFKSHEAEMIRFNIPECDTLIYDSDDYWTCYARYFGTTLYHYSGTCKMGPDTDPQAVVDSRLRVKGITGLRVMDASIMPTITSGNINAPTIMIGEKGADLIKEDWK